MSQQSIGVAVIGAGMAGRAHCAGYRSAPTLFDPPLPPIHYAAVIDANEAVADDAAERYGYERHGTDWRELLDADDVAGRQRRRRQPPAPRDRRGAARRRQARALREAARRELSTDARAMVDAAAGPPRPGHRAGFVYRRQPAVAAIRDLLRDELGEVSHFNGRYWCDYARSARDAHGLALQGRAGHRCPRRHRQPPHRPRRVRLRADDPGRAVPPSPRRSPSAAVRSARPTATPGPSSATSSEPVENDDVATFTAHFASGAVGHLLDLAHRPRARQLARLRPDGRDTAPPSGTWTGRPSSRSSASCATTASTATTRSSSGRPTPTSRAACRWTSPAVSFGVGDLFGYQARAFLEQVAGIEGLPPVAPFEDGVRDLTDHRRRHPLGRRGRRRPSTSPAHHSA